MKLYVLKKKILYTVITIITVNIPCYIENFWKYIQGERVAKLKCVLITQNFQKQYTLQKRLDNILHHPLLSQNSSRCNDLSELNINPFYALQYW